MESTSISLRAIDCDLGDVTSCRAKLLDIVSGPQFQSVLEDLRITRQSAVAGPAPRGGEASIGAEAHSNGDWSVRAEAKVTF